MAGDAAALGYPDASFDTIVSGTMTPGGHGPPDLRGNASRDPDLRVLKEAIP